VQYPVPMARAPCSTRRGSSLTNPRLRDRSRDRSVPHESPRSLDALSVASLSVGRATGAVKAVSPVTGDVTGAVTAVTRGRNPALGVAGVAGGLPGPSAWLAVTCATEVAIALAA
jgi:hypothetical protein